jgi:hypothetical protein
MLPRFFCYISRQNLHSLLIKLPLTLSAKWNEIWFFQKYQFIFFNETYWWIESNATKLFLIYYQAKNSRNPLQELQIKTSGFSLIKFFFVRNLTWHQITDLIKMNHGINHFGTWNYDKKVIFKILIWYFAPKLGPFLKWRYSWILIAQNNQIKLKIIEFSFLFSAIYTWDKGPTPKIWLYELYQRLLSTILSLIGQTHRKLADSAK